MSAREHGCPSCLSAEGEVVLSAKDAARLTAAFEPLVGEHTAVSVNGVRLFLVNQKRMEVDLAAARIEGAERALLERDVAEVAYHAERCDDVLRELNEDVAEGYDLSADDAERERWMRRQLDTMWPWLARAKAVLG